MRLCHAPETPPRTWGRRLWSWQASGWRRNTPTHVGKTYHAHAWIRDLEKHPHARGEDCSAILMPSTVVETPPRTWGRPLGYGSSSVSKRKHPHARGEDDYRPLFICRNMETPPRTWGRLMRPPCAIVDPGNTPTHVGKTGARRCVRQAGGKHPHARGEDRACSTVRVSD